MDSDLEAALHADGKTKTSYRPRAVALDEFNYVLRRILLSRTPHLGLDHLYKSGIFNKMIPELEYLHKTSQEAGRLHKDVWEHTKTVVKQAVPRERVRYAALFHDVGKPQTLRFEGGVTFHNHDVIGAKIWKKIAHRLEITNPLKSDVWFLVRYHLRVSQYNPEWTDNAVRRFYTEMGDYIEDVFALARADVTTGNPQKRQAVLQSTKELKERVDRLKEEDAKPKLLPKGLGTEIANAFALAPGPELGRLMKDVRAAVERGEIEAGSEPSYYVEWLSNDISSSSKKA